MGDRWVGAADVIGAAEDEDTDRLCQSHREAEDRLAARVGVTLACADLTVEIDPADEPGGQAAGDRRRQGPTGAVR